jgi:hypothetical protein
MFLSSFKSLTHEALDFILHHFLMVEMATAGLLTCVLKLMASGLPEKLSVTMVLAAIRRLQQRDCPGFSPDSLLITTHSSCLRRQKVAANQLRVQRYYKKMNKKITLSAFLFQQG